MRLHSYWTCRILDRCPPLSSLALTASSHHERRDGDGYHRGIPSADLPVAAQLLAAADVFAALTEPRPHRAAMTAASAARQLGVEVAAGRLHPDACAAVIEAAGLPRPEIPVPCGLTEREIEVLRLAARGLSNRPVRLDEAPVVTTTAARPTRQQPPRPAKPKSKGGRPSGKKRR